MMYGNVMPIIPAGPERGWVLKQGQYPPTEVYGQGYTTTCFLCGHRATLLPYSGTAGSYLKCEYCGEFGIVNQVLDYIWVPNWNAARLRIAQFLHQRMERNQNGILLEPELWDRIYESPYASWSSCTIGHAIGVSA